MSKVWKFTFYATDPDGNYNEDSVVNQIWHGVADGLDMILSDIEVETGRIDVEQGDVPVLGCEDCPVSEWEKYM